MNKEQNDGVSSTPFDVRKIALAIAVLALIVTSAGILAIGTDSADGEDRSYTRTWTSGDCTLTYECTVYETWRLDHWVNVQYHGGVLTVSGDGAMDDYQHEPNSDWCNTPWLNRYNESEPYHGHDIRVIVEEGVTYIGSCAFTDLEVAEVKLPSTLFGIGDYAFEGTNLKVVDIPDSVTYLGDRIFKDCGKLDTVRLPNGITKLGTEMFMYSTVEKADIPSSVRSLNGAFAYSNIGSAVIPDGVTKIDDNSFDYCRNLKSIVIPDSVTSIGDYAFSDCAMTEANLKNVEYIGHNAFSSCYGLKSAILPNLKSLSTGSFSKCSSLEYVYLPGSLTEIPVNAFSECTSLKTMILPGSIEKIGLGAFDKTGLEYVSIPDSVKTIAAVAFSNAKLKSVVIPESVREIGFTAFYSETLKYVSIETADAFISPIAFFGPFEGFRIPSNCTGSVFAISKFYDTDKTTEISAETAAASGYTWSTVGMPLGSAYRVADAEPKTLTFTWMNWDGTVLQTDTNVAVKDWPPYKGDRPVNKYGLTFNGWNGIEDGFGNVILIASFQPGELDGIGGDDGMGGDSEGGDADMDGGSGDHPKTTFKSVLKFVRSLLRLWFR